MFILILNEQYEQYEQYERLALCEDDQDICLYFIERCKKTWKVSKKLGNVMLSSDDGCGRRPKLEMFYEYVLVKGWEISQRELTDLYDDISYEQREGFFRILKNNLKATNVKCLIKACCELDIFLECLYDALDHYQIRMVAAILHKKGLLSYEEQISTYLERIEEVCSEEFGIFKLLSELAGIDMREIANDYEVVGEYLREDV